MPGWNDQKRNHTEIWVGPQMYHGEAGPRAVPLAATGEVRAAGGILTSRRSYEAIGL